MLASGPVAESLVYQLIRWTSREPHFVKSPFRDWFVSWSCSWNTSPGIWWHMMNIKFMGKIQVGTIYQKKLVTFVSKAEIDMTQETQQTQLSILVKIIASIFSSENRTWNLQIDFWKRRFLFGKPSFFRFHVKLWGYIFQDFSGFPDSPTRILMEM